MAFIWGSGFENNDNNEFTFTSGYTNQATVAYDGSRAGRINSLASGTGKYVQQQFVTSDSTIGYFTHYRLRVDTYPSADNTILVFFSSIFDGVIYLQMTSAGVLKLYTPTGLVATSSALSTGTFHKIQIAFDGSGGGGAGTAELIVNDVSAGSVSNHTIGGVTYLSIGANLFSEANTAGDFYIDTIILNNDTGSDMNTTLAAGAIKLAYARPNAAGDNNQWLKKGGGLGTSTNYQDYDEVTSDDLTTYVKRTSTGTFIDDVNVESSATIGLASTDTIYAVAVGARIGAGNATATNRDGIYRIKSASGATVLESGAIDWSVNGFLMHKDGSDRNYQLASYTDPTTGVAWTPTGTNSVDNMQIGFKNASSSANEIRVTQLWALVIFGPATAITPLSHINYPNPTQKVGTVGY